MKILIVGSGEIGTRHLQAVASLPFVKAIDIVDPRPESLMLGQSRLDELGPNKNPECSFQWCSSLTHASKDNDFAIVATQAEGRAALISQIAELGVQKFLIEKTVTQSVEEYETILNLAEKRDLKIWVNCKTRAYSVHQQAKKNFKSQDPIQFHVFAGNHGLMVNGIHSLDLFVFYDESRSLKSVHIDIDPVLHASKRGSRLFDLSGAIVARSDKGSLFSMVFHRDHLAFPWYCVQGSDYRLNVEHAPRHVFEAKKINQWIWQPVAFDDKMDISDMTQRFVTDIFEKEHCPLPLLQDCYLAHSFLLTELKPFFSRLLGKELHRCPVT